ncbi:efflux RND transporter periplasmic adaptor subunit [Sediminibacterium sp.]|uniref:efflux RND transporter periplasmic adaptor subunit n=1 Tax=Sediminibacterium sp. TaxID=1917865 RepID=UPI0025F30C2A|nr:efflux RND transporter periplasmic adaptor subunit [Sediminibacterium sp.]MDP3393341.1 efflux RND transporter periplasmic adaptor subunit [Sediminibacterium sp.]MDP3567943.1 efflux RND transporter periplasmic adaptor subunit [Sediminibacterium sp.]
MKQKIFSSLAILFLAAVLFSACSSKENAAAAAPEEPKKEEAGMVDLSEDQFKTVNIQYGAVEEKNLSSVIRASGDIEAPPQQLITVSTPYGGIVKSIPLLEGKFVSQGQVVAVLENPEFIQLQQDYLDYKSQLGYLKEELERQQELAKENVNAKKTVQKASSEYNSMVARVQGLKSKLQLININPDKVGNGNLSSRSNIYAPAPGYVTKVKVNTGKYVNANEALVEIADTRELHVELNVFEKDVPKLKAGQKVRFVLNNETKERLAEISLIGREIGTDRTVRVHCRLLKEDRDLLPGLFLKAIVETGLATTTALPDKAIVQAAGKSYIFIASDEVKEEKAPAEKGKDAAPGEKHIPFKRIEVTTGVSENGYTEVILPEGFDRSSKVVINGAYDLLSKMNNVEEEE